MNEKIRISIASDQDCDSVFAEIYANGKFLGRIIREHDRSIIEFPGPNLDESLIARTVPLSDFLDAIEIAERRLLG